MDDIQKMMKADFDRQIQEAVEIVPGVEVSYASVSQWQTRGVVVEVVNPTLAIVEWKSSGLYSSGTIKAREWIGNLRVWVGGQWYYPKQYAADVRQLVYKMRDWP